MTAIAVRQVCEFHARAFLGDETWRAWKTDYDSLMAFRKTIKGKPDEAQLFQIRMNSDWIAFYDQVLWHAPFLGVKACVCGKCAKQRQLEAKKP